MGAYDKEQRMTHEAKVERLAAALKLTGNETSAIRKEDGIA